MRSHSIDGPVRSLTTHRTLQRGAAKGWGTESPYYELVEGPGEPHIVRLELAPGAVPATTAHTGTRASLLHFAFLTDMHILDDESPGRYEFVERLHGNPDLHLLLPAYRPQEVLHLQACEVMLETVRAIERSQITGAPLQFVICGGDNADNSQLNELQTFIQLMQGGIVYPASGGPTYEGVGSPEWQDPNYWHPDDYEDHYKRRWAFPSHPGLLQDASLPFVAAGVGIPWLSCFGNHDTLALGTARPNDSYQAIATGSRKPLSVPDGFDPLDHLDLFIPHPETFLHGPARVVTPDPARRLFTRREFITAHLDAGGEPQGHGFTPQNLAENTTYYVHDACPTVRLIVLDTVNPGGNYQGSVGAAQMAWLEERLIEAHSRYFDVSSRVVETGNEDRLVVICSHHGLSRLTNDLTAPDVEADLPRVLGPGVESFLHRFPNVILWLNGHTHRNQVIPRPDPKGCTLGFWEVTTGSLLDWPGQGRLVEIVSNQDGTLSLICTMIDHGAPPDPRQTEEILYLASLHRELAANDPHAGIAGPERGQPPDRNVELVIPVPCPIE